MKKFLFLLFALAAGSGCAKSIVAHKVDTVASMEATARCAEKHSEKFCLKAQEGAVAAIKAVAESQATWGKQPDIEVVEDDCGYGYRGRSCNLGGDQVPVGTRVRTGRWLPVGSSNW